MSNARGQHVDKTYLSVNLAEKRGFLHRDYIAHCLRWSHVIKQLGVKQGYKAARLLDIGCGRELPLASTLYSSRFIVEKYYGVDVGPINDEDFNRVASSGKFPIEVYENTDAVTITPEDLGGQAVNWVTCFEMLEHVEPMHMWELINHLRSLISKDCNLFFSTPCWNVKDCAANHVNEIKYDVLGSIFEMADYKIVGKYGTFASQSDIRDDIQNDGLTTLFETFKAYFDSNVLSCLFAPLYPANSRNVLWHLQPANGNRDKQFPQLQTIPEPWGSSEKWDEFKHRVMRFRV